MSNNSQTRPVPSLTEEERASYVNTIQSWIREGVQPDPEKLASSCDVLQSILRTEGCLCPNQQCRKDAAYDHISTRGKLKPVERAFLRYFVDQYVFGGDPVRPIVVVEWVKALQYRYLFHVLGWKDRRTKALAKYAGLPRRRLI